MDSALETSRAALAAAISAASFSEDIVSGHGRQIQQELIAKSRYLREPNFTAIHTDDLAFLFHAYDHRFFAGLYKQALNGRRLTFRLSPRMTRAGGTTTRLRSRTGGVSYEIAIASSILFDGFGANDREVTVCGLPCANRLDALRRIFEHELVHLAEQLCWDASDCAAPRFQNIAARCFLHRAHTHALITRRERAAATGVRVGSMVSFQFEGVPLIGRVNRITKRATVLVEATEGAPFSDGKRYRTYYVPIRCLTPVQTESGLA